MGGRKDIPCISHRVGTSFEAQKWLSLDMCGLLGVSCSWAVHLFSFYTLARYMITGSFFSTAIFMLLYVPVSILAMAGLYMAWTTDPGAVPLGARPLVTVRRASSSSVGETSSSPSVPSRRRATRRCPKCADNFKPARAHHDSVTGRCIVKFDHFCPWVGNAIGAMNHKHFVLFIAYTLCSCLISILLIVIRAIHCASTIKSDSSEDTTPNNNNELEGNVRYLRGTLGSPVTFVYQECEAWHGSYAVIGLMIVSVVFLIFTCTMLFDQVEAIETNTSKIARMKMRVGNAGTELSRVTEEFNEMFGGEDSNFTWHWLLPLPVQFPNGMEKVVLGYEWDETFDPVPFEDGSGSEEGSADPLGTPGRLGARIEMTTRKNGDDVPDRPQVAQQTLAGPSVAPQALTKRSNSRGSVDNLEDRQIT